MQVVENPLLKRNTGRFLLALCDMGPSGESGFLAHPYPEGEISKVFLSRLDAFSSKDEILCKGIGGHSP